MFLTVFVLCGTLRSTRHPRAGVSGEEFRWHALVRRPLPRRGSSALKSLSMEVLKEINCVDRLLNHLEEGHADDFLKSALVEMVNQEALEV